jgi:N-methylhydantoinase A/oxoprolinase/acetone carboxylase beta subunit
MRGAALLSGIDQAMVCDVGGTTSDIGCLINGFPRQANAVVKVGGVRTLFRMPDLLSIAIGGGSRVSSDGMAVGPQSLGYRLAEQAMVFGGEHLCATDIAVAAGLADIGDASLVQNIDSATVTESIRQIHRTLADAIDSMKSDATEVPLLAVGGGAMLVPSTIDGISEVVQVENGAVANAVGAAIAQISGETDRVYRDVDRADALADAKQLAVNAAVEAGADASSIRTVEMEDLPLSYLPGNSLRVRVRVVGDLKTSTCSEADVRAKI